MKQMWVCCGGKAGGSSDWLPAGVAKSYYGKNCRVRNYPKSGEVTTAMEDPNSKAGEDGSGNMVGSFADKNASESGTQMLKIYTFPFSTSLVYITHNLHSYSSMQRDSLASYPLPFIAGITLYFLFCIYYWFK